MSGKNLKVTLSSVLSISVNQFLSIPSLSTNLPLSSIPPLLVQLPLSSIPSLSANLSLSSIPSLSENLSLSSIPSLSTNFPLSSIPSLSTNLPLSSTPSSPAHLSHFSFQCYFTVSQISTISITTFPFLFFCSSIYSVNSPSQAPCAGGGATHYVFQQLPSIAAWGLYGSTVLRILHLGIPSHPPNVTTVLEKACTLYDRRVSAL